MEQAKTLSEKVAQTLTDMIRDNAYTAGDRLPTEKELCAMVGAGRNTVREALRLLASRNIVTIRQGAGMFVAQKTGVVEDPLGFSMMSDRKKLTTDLLQVRLMIEPPIAALAAQCATEHDIAELLAFLEAMESAMRKHKPFAQQDAAFHQKIAECTHNDVMGNLMPIIGNGIATFAREVEKTEYKQTLVSHRKIFEHIRAHRPFEAEMEMRFHLLYNSNRYQSEEK